MAPGAAAQRPRPLGWLFAGVLVADGSIAGWCLAYLLYGNKIPSAYFPYFFNVGSGLLLLLAGMGLLALVSALTNVFRKRGRQALVWLLLCVFSGGSCVLAYFPVMLATGAISTDDGRQNP